MKKLYYFLILALLISGTCHSGNASTSLCSRLLAQDLAQSLREIDQFQAEIKNASETYSKNFPDAAISMLRGEEHLLLNPLKTQGTDMIYIASGGDVYRPMMDFPLVGHYHFMDALTGWGKGPLDTLNEIKRRLEGFPDAQVTILQKGFIEALPESEFGQTWNRSKAAQYFSQSEDLVLKAKLLEPYVLSVRFKSSGFGITTKYFYVHLMDFTNSQHFDHLLKFIPRGSLAGTLQAGVTGTPHAHDIRKLFDWGTKSSLFIWEAGSSNPIESEQTTSELNSYLNGNHVIEFTTPIFDPEWFNAHQRTILIHKRSLL